MKRSLYIVLILSIICVPRMVRVLYPKVWIEDPNYIYGAYLLTKGYMPYRDFAQPNLPTLEQALAIAYRLIAPTYRIPELITAICGALIAAIIYLISRFLYNSKAALCGALLFSLHPLVFRYHLFDREVFTALFTALCFYFLLIPRFSVTWRAMFISAALIMGFTCKQTMFVTAFAVGIYLVVSRRFKEVIIVTLCTALGVALINYIYYLTYGNDFIQQIFTFHLIKGVGAPILTKMSWFAIGLHFIFPIGIVSLALLIVKRKAEALLIGITLGLEFVFDAVISATFWPHYLIPALVPMGIACAGGFSLAFSGLGSDRKSRIIPLIFSMGLLSSLLWGFVIHVRTSPSLEETMGFSGVERIKLLKLSEQVQKWTDPESTIVCQPMEGLVCKRKRLVNFEDNWGVMLALKRALANGTFEAFKAEMAQKDFAQIRRESSIEWLPDVIQGIKNQTISAFIPNYETPLDIRFLEKNGYQLVYEDPPYQLWTPKGSP